VQYHDSVLAFSIAYPPNFAIADSLNPGGTLPPGQLLEKRVVDRQYSSGEPPGQVEFGVYAKDAGAIDAWIQKHTGQCGSADANEFFWDSTANLTSTAAAGRAAMTFDWSPCGSPVALHVTTFFMDGPYVFRIDWWATEPNYTTSIKSVASQMIASFNG
jgi:hypothetical protein